MKHIFLFALLLSLAFANERPLWLEKFPDDERSYFRGVSRFYFLNDSLAMHESKEEACKQATDELGNYIGMRHSSDLSISQSISDGKTSKKMSVQSHSSSNQLLVGVKEYDSYIQYNEDKTSFCTWCLISLDKETEKIIRAALKKDKNAFEQTLVQIIAAFDEKFYKKAEDLISLAKGYRSAQDDGRLEALELRLIEIKKELLEVFVQLNKESYYPNDEIEVSLSSSKRAFVYLFYFDGYKYEMVFPNLAAKRNHLGKSSLMQLPTESMQEEGIYIQAYDDLKDAKGSFMALASKKSLFLESMNSDEGESFLIYETNGKWKSVIKKCIEEGDCSQKEVSFVLSTKNRKNIKIELKFSKNTQYKSFLTEMFNKALEDDQVNLCKNKVDYYVYIRLKKEKAFSSQMGVMVHDIDISIELQDVHKKKKKRYFADKIRLIDSSESKIKDALDESVIRLSKELVNYL